MAAANGGKEIQGIQNSMNIRFASIVSRGHLFKVSSQPHQTMTKSVSSILACALAAGLVSCGGPNSQTGAVIGALAGAGAGGIIGHQSGRGLEGAAIGGALGAVGGAVVGDAQDKRNAEYYYRDRDGRYYQGDGYYGAPPPPPPPPRYRGGYYRGY